LFLILAISLLIAAWQALLPSQEWSSAPEIIADAGQPESSGGGSQPLRLPQQAFSTKIADAGLILSDSGAMDSLPPGQLGPEAELPNGPDHTGSNPSSVPPEASAGETSSAGETPLAIETPLASELPMAAPHALPASVKAPVVASAVSNASLARKAEPGPTATPVRSSGLIDLNTAPLNQLNALRGAGLIGRAIVRGRPYASAEDLVKKRVLNRSTYVRIKSQITVR
jgi:hypothetical protein